MNLFSRYAIAAILPITLGLALSACTGGDSSAPFANPAQKGSGFLPEYNLLKPVHNPPANTEIYTYKAPNYNSSDYHAVLIAPVGLYQTAEPDKTNGVTEADLKAVQNNIQAGITKIVSPKMPVNQKAGPGVVRLQVAITGAMVQPEGLKPWNFLPISAVITVASNISGLEDKTPAIMVELKFTDSQTGKLLRETVTIIRGDSFREKSYTSDAFEQLSEQ